nr:IS91 family transposase [Desulfosediminicola ganghwensis]
MATIVEEYLDAYLSSYGSTALPGHLKTFTAIISCRTPASGELHVQCPDCNHAEWRPLSCGNRHCPKCQNHNTSQWLDRQQQKLLPVPYFMATFTLPRELRPLAWFNQKAVYDLMFKVVSVTLKDFGLNPKNLGAEIGMTMVLHTNSRPLDFHPHIHAVIPGGGIDRRRRYWKKTQHNYLFNGNALAKVFRARFLDALKGAGLKIPQNLPKEWVVHCDYAGKGMAALKYLSRYLYRGVISEKNIIENRDGKVTFKYVDSTTGETKQRTLRGEAFLNLVVTHVLPKGFRRVRDYGFLHSNAKKLLTLVQMILHVITALLSPRTRPTFKCPCCKNSMLVIGFRRDIRRTG